MRFKKSNILKIGFPQDIQLKLLIVFFLHHKYKKRINKYIKKSPLNKTEGYKYSGLFFLLLPDIIAHITGQNFETYLYNKIYKPANINRLRYNPLAYFPREQIVPSEYDSLFRRQLVHGNVHDGSSRHVEWYFLQRGIIWQRRRLGKLFQLYLDHGIYQGEQIIDSIAIAEFTRCQFCENGNRRGLGFDKPLMEYIPG